MSETTKVNRKRISEDWDKIHEEAKSAREKIPLPAILLDRSKNMKDWNEDETNSYGDYTDEESKAGSKVYDKHHKVGSLMDRSIKDIDEQYKEDERRESYKFDKLKKMLRGE
jgi:hypothetical protein